MNNSKTNAPAGAQPSGRIVFADWLRVVACFLVMLVHASETFYAADDSGLAGDHSMLMNEANRFWVAFYDGTLGRTCVPLFMIISAFLLVPMKQGVTMRGFYKRRFLRIVPPMIAFLLIYTFLPVVWGQMSWDDAMASLSTIPWNFAPMAGHMWFLYPLISIYIIIPVVSPWLEKASAQDERTFLYLFILSTFLPFVHRFVSAEVWGECFWNGFHMFWYCSGYLGYLVLAHYIRYHIKWDRAKRFRVGMICLVVGSVFTGWSFWWKGVPMQPIYTPMLEWAWEFCTPNVLMATFGAFLLFTCIEQTKAPKIVTDISKLSYGMYLMHLLFLSNIAAWFVNGNVAEPRVHVAVAIPLIAIASYICCYVTAKVISYIPGSKWIIG